LILFDLVIEEQEITGTEQVSVITTGRWMTDKRFMWFFLVLIKGEGHSSNFRL
jgi:hypothetical protein